MSEPSTRRNALAGETSPYLVQHADNPVDWHPWSPEALAIARERDRPILLSVGYSACHWCHVMAHESFEDPATAELMNALYVNIKVDREERPDLDKIYQLAHQLLTRRPGGWPLTMFISPHDHRPFFAGTYFPSTPRHGMPSFRQVLESVADAYRNQRDQIDAQGESLIEALESLETPPGDAGALDRAPIDQARALLGQSFDREHGGFGGAPKFPHPTNLERLMRDHARSVAHGAPDEQARTMARFSLHRMSAGGLYDHVGGGFCRYSVDERWMIPHFEKMLYDNGPLLALTAQGAQAWRDPVLARVARETAEWTLREMQSPEGGYYSTLDADSEGEEGLFYLWTPDEVAEILTPDELSVFAPRFGLDREPNFEAKAWHLHGFRDVESIAAESALTPAEVETRIANAAARLYEVRAKRVWPGRDEKILTSWNALMIKAMTIASGVLGEPRYLESAERALGFLERELWRDGRLLATHKDGRSHLPAYLDDYAFLLDALLALIEARWRRADLELAIALAEVLLNRFEDRERGGFYFTADDHESLIVRSRPFMDDALPAGNGVAATALARLGHLLGDTRYLDAAHRTLVSGWAGVEQLPHAHNAMLVALEEHLEPIECIVVRGEGEALRAWRERCRRHYVPWRMTVAIDASETDLPGLLGERAAGADTRAYVCRGTHCEAPVDDFESLEAILAASETFAPDSTPGGGARG